jgi:1-acyl-sn-glycerol-3-phosphate acyltransferase
MGLLHAGRHVGRGLFNSLAALGALRLSPPREPRTAAERLSIAVGALAEAHDLDLRVHGELPTQGSLIVANHVSYLDPIAILSLTPALPIAKVGVSGWPLVGSLARRFGVMFVERDDPMERAIVLRQVHALLRAGVSVLNFPEGTTTPGVHVAPFWRGSFGIAQRLGVPVVPVALRYRDPALAWVGDATFLPHYLRTVRSARVELSLSFGPPMHPRTGEVPEAMAARARGLISHMLETMRSIDAGPSPRLPSPRSDSVLPAADVAKIA